MTTGSSATAVQHIGYNLVFLGFLIDRAIHWILSAQKAPHTCASDIRGRWNITCPRRSRSPVCFIRMPFYHKLYITNSHTSERYLRNGSAL